jgi:predicted permease
VDALKVAVADRAADTPVLRSLGPDIRQALRIYRREPLLALSIAATLALGIGATTAVYSAVHDILIRDLPLRHEERLAVLYSTTPRTQGMYGSYADVQDFRAQMKSAEWIGGTRGASATWTAADEARRVDVLRVTDRFLSEIGARFLVGRDFAETEQTAAVASRVFAERHFGSAQGAMGQSLMMDDGAAVIVGVLADTIELPRAPDLFRPYAVGRNEIAARGSNAVFIIARLRPGIAIESADVEAKLIQKRLAETHSRERDNDVRLTPLRAEVVGRVEQPLRMTFIAVLLVLAVALTSVLSLLMARAASRAGEVAVRVSLGASRARLSRLWAIEALVLALPGALGGLALAYGLVAVFNAALPPNSGRLNTMKIDGAAIAGAAALMVLAAALFSLAPRVLGLGRMRLVVVKDAARSVAGLRRARWQSVLLAGQVGLSVVLVCCAVWLAASMSRLHATPLGFDAAGVTAAQFSITRAMRMDSKSTAAFVEQVLAAVRALGPVEQAAVSNGIPGARTSGYILGRIRPGDPEFAPGDEVSVVQFVVSPSFFSVFRIPLLRGRVFDEADRATPLNAVVVSESFARKYLKDGDLGTRLAISGGGRTEEVIGVVADVHADALGRDSGPQIYFVDGYPALLGTVSMRAKAGAAINTNDVKAIFRRLNPDVLVRVLPMSDVMAIALESRALATRSAYAFAAIALLLAAINIYGLAALTVLQRKREIGIRMALGAGARDAVGMIVRRGAKWIAAGAAAGLAAAIFGAAPAIRSQLFQTDTGEPLLISAALVAVFATAALALWLPARRAAAIDPAITLRAD